LDDSFSDIFRDLFGGITSGGGVLNDVVDFLEDRVDGFSSDTSVEFEDLMSSNNLDEMKAEMENTRLLLDQLQKRSRKLNVERIASEKEAVAMKAGAKRVTDIEELDRQMAVVERAAGVKARYEEMQGHVKASKRRLLAAGEKSCRPQGRWWRGDTKKQQRLWQHSSDNSGRDDGGRRTGSSSSGGSVKPQPTPSSSPPPKPPRRRVPGGRRRTDDPDVEAELARMKREMGM
ncbi:unnamed protein product, partial [Laminaria digitata]